MGHATEITKQLYRYFEAGPGHLQASPLVHWNLHGIFIVVPGTSGVPKTSIFLESCCSLSIFLCKSCSTCSQASLSHPAPSSKTLGIHSTDRDSGAPANPVRGSMVEWFLSIRIDRTVISFPPFRTLCAPAARLPPNPFGDVDGPGSSQASSADRGDTGSRSSRVSWAVPRSWKAYYLYPGPSPRNTSGEGGTANYVNMPRLFPPAKSVQLQSPFQRWNKSGQQVRHQLSG